MAGNALGVAMTVVGDNPTQVCGFYGTGTTQRAGSTQAALTLTTATGSGFGFSTSAAFNAFISNIEEMRATMVAMGLMKGSA